MFHRRNDCEHAARPRRHGGARRVGLADSPYVGAKCAGSSLDALGFVARVTGEQGNLPSMGSRAL